MVGRRRKPGLVVPNISGFESRLLSLGYTPGTTRGMLKVVGNVGRWLALEGLTASDFNESRVGPFVKYRHDAGYRQKKDRSVFTLLMAFLREQGVLPAALVKPPTALQVFFRGYRQWLTDECDLAKMTILRYVNLARRFLDITDGERSDMRDPSVLRGSDVAAFMLLESGRVSLGSARGHVAELRSLLRYIHLRHVTELDLAISVPSVAGWRDAGQPDSLAASEVEKLVGFCDGTRASATRDLAILLLLTRWGLQSIEVVRLK